MFLPPIDRRSAGTGSRVWRYRTWHAWRACCTRSCRTSLPWPPEVRQVSASGSHLSCTGRDTWPTPRPRLTGGSHTRPRSTLRTGRIRCRTARSQARYQAWTGRKETYCRWWTPARRLRWESFCAAASPRILEPRTRLYPAPARWRYLLQPRSPRSYCVSPCRSLLPLFYGGWHPRLRSEHARGECLQPLYGVCHAVRSRALRTAVGSARRAEGPANIAWDVRIPLSSHLPCPATNCASWIRPVRPGEAWATENEPCCGLLNHHCAYNNKTPDLTKTNRLITTVNFIAGHTKRKVTPKNTCKDLQTDPHAVSGYWQIRATTSE